MYQVGMEYDTRAYFTAVTILISLPTSTKIFNWACSLLGIYKNLFILVCPGLIYSFMFILYFSLGGSTGVILSSAIIDISLHDRNNYIKKFFVGLMDGDGSIQVNHWRKINLQYRLVIKLKNNNANINMLNIISKEIGGRVVLDGDFVKWVMDDKKLIQKTILIFESYPLLTSTKICQLAFLKKCLDNPSVTDYLNSRDNKYDFVPPRYPKPRFALETEGSARGPRQTDQGTWEVPEPRSLKPRAQPEVLAKPQDILSLSYFPSWLSGFIEAEGCFSIRKNNNHSFSISQKHDAYLLEAIKLYFNASNIVRTPSPDFYLLEIYKKDVLKNVINHCKTYPLLGLKNISFHHFIDKLHF